MRVKRIVVPPQALEAGRGAMRGDFSTADVTQAVRSANEDVGLDVGEFTSEEFASLVAAKLVKAAIDAERAVSIDTDVWRML